MRLDKYLFENKYFTSREKAQTAIAHNTVKVDGAIVTKASKEVDDSMQIEIIDLFNKFVSLGGLKLEKAILNFNIDFFNKRVLDIGASTGGFTDCALQHGAAHVTAIDVGNHQLVETLRNNPLVTSLENTDFRNLTMEDVHNQPFDYLVSDVSFISLTYILPYCAPFLKEDGKMIFLIKPQFEAGASFLGRSGIVTDERGYKIAIQRVVNEALNQHYYLNGITISTLFEQHKNVEFLALFSRNDNHYNLNLPKICEEVRELKKKL